VTKNTDCEQMRLTLMAAVDSEDAAAGDSGPAARQHLASCAACTDWLRAYETMNARLRDVAYPTTRADLWPALEPALQRSLSKPRAQHRLYVMAVIVLGWRALQLLVDLPLPLLQSVIPLAVGLAALWQLARDPFAIQTTAPELQKRGA
jgi:predicted anti-sigma-YlaC factor YlaD